ncbi:MAG: cobalamin B12-binding domain-containing protein [Candidatus Aminicenantes bacterium]
MERISKKKLIAASLGHCVHVAGILKFLKLAEDHGYQTQFLGPAFSIEKLTESIKFHNPDVIALSYRLTPDALQKLLTLLKQEIERNRWQNKKFLFGGTPPTAEVARKSGIFESVFGGQESLDEIVSVLKGHIKEAQPAEIPPQNLKHRIDFKAPFPLLRHHFGQPDMEQTIEGAKQIALSQAIDVISLGPDQNAQESFFRPNEMRREQDGAGGVPLRKPEDLAAIYEASRCGNFPLVRCYAGTRDLVKWAEMTHETINIAWGAVPLCWYNKLDGRSERSLLESIKENQQAMRWYSQHDIPLEVNESHHWSLRDAPDTVAVAAAFLAAHNAKRMGSKCYVAQYMFNTPAATSPPMDLAKMMAKIELIEPLHDKNFFTIRQTRTGLASLSYDADIAKGQLSVSTFYQMILKPKIVHVVGFCEGDHAATSEEVIASAKIVQGVINQFSSEHFPFVKSSVVRERKKELVEEAKFLLAAIKEISAGKVEDPWSDPATIAQAIKIGLLDAPHLCGNPQAAGRIFTQIRNGACVAVDLESGKILKEKERISRILETKCALS